MPTALIPLQSNQAVLLGNLWQYYQFESSVREGLDVDPDGRFETPDEVFSKALNLQDGNSVYLVRFENSIAGFLILLSAEIEGTPITEFADLFILPKYRGLGVGSQVIEQVILRSSQPFLIAVFRDDPKAAAFWRSAFKRLPFKSVREIMPPELPDFHEFVVNEASGA